MPQFEAITPLMIQQPSEVARTATMAFEGGLQRVVPVAQRRAFERAYQDLLYLQSE